MIIFPSVIMVMPEGDDRDYMEQLYIAHSRLMFATAWKYYNEKTIVEDIVSDSCIAFIKKTPTLRRLSDEKLKAYIISTVKNVALNYNDKQKRECDYTLNHGDAMLESLSDNFDIEKKVELADELSRVWSAIRQLPEKEQQIMYLKYAMDMPDAIIAERVGLSENSIRKYISRAREHIRKMVYTE